MPYANVNDITLYYEVHGEDGSPLVMIHGYGGMIASWSPALLDRLCAHHRVILLDNRGSGRSDKPTAPYMMANFAADVAGLLDVLQIDRAHVLGASLGGMIAQHVAIRYPARVDRLILACTAMAGPNSPHMVAPAPGMLEQLTKPPSGDLAQDLRDSWPLNYTPVFIQTQRDLLEGLVQAMVAYPPTPAYALQLQLDAIFQTHDTYTALPQLTCPTLILAGTADKLIPVENARRLAHVIPHAQLITYPSLGHGFLEEHTAPAAHDILAFLAAGERDTGASCSLKAASDEKVSTNMVMQATTFSPEEIAQAAQINANAFCFVVPAYAKAQGLSLAECWTFIGRNFASTWPQDMPLNEVAQRVALNLVSSGYTLQSFSCNASQAEIVVTDWPSPIACERFQLTQAEADTMFALFEPIAPQLNCHYQWQRRGDTIVMTFTR